MFQEAVFFHKESGTLIFTDLRVNLKADGIGLLPRWFLKFDQVLFPNGGVSRLYRWFVGDKPTARKSLKKNNSWSPRQITFCHGETFIADALQVLAREFKWLEK